jgi:beta-lactamase class A
VAGSVESTFIPSTTAAATTITTAAATTTTEPPPPCRPDPFADYDVSPLLEGYPNALITAHVYDTRTGCEYELNRDTRSRTASVFKVMVMAGALLEAQREARPVSEWEMGQLTPMITKSANSPVGSLWRHFGASPWFSRQGEIFGLEETTINADHDPIWGATLTSARDQVALVRQVLLGEWGPIGSRYRRVALQLMTSVVPEQSWGVSAGVPDGWVVALKNGFAGATINSVGWVDEPGPSRGYVVAILSYGWPNHPTGIAAVEEVSERIAASMTLPWPP